MAQPVWRSRPGEMVPASEGTQRINDFIHLSEGLSNSFLITTDEGNVVVNTGMFFYFRNVRSQVTVPLAHVQEELVADTVAVVDSLLQDSLSIVVDELVDHVLEKNEEVAILKDSTEALTTRLQQLQAELGTMDDRKVDLKDQDLERLSRVFGSMQPAKAAPVMLKMDNAAVAGILLSIEERTAAKILAAMPPEKAAEIARLIRERATLKQAGQRQ